MKNAAPTKTDRFMQIAVMSFYTVLYTSASVVMSVTFQPLNDAFLEAPIPTGAGMAAAIVIGLNLTAKQVFKLSPTNNDQED